MRFLIPLVVQILLLLLLSFPAVSQRPESSPTPKVDDVVKISTNLVQTDVTVTDKDGKIVRNLKPEDFEIYENGKKQAISSFSFVSNTREREQTQKTVVGGSSERQAPPPPALPARTGPVRRTIALVVDDITLSLDSVDDVRRALRHFVDEQMQEGDVVAIIRTGSGIGSLQQFTTDKRLLYAAIDRVKWSIIGTGSLGAFPMMEPESPTEEREGGERNGGIRTAAGRRKEFEDFQASVFATGTLGAVNYVIRGMQELPGRKSIVLLSQGFKLYQEDATGFKEGSDRVMRSLQKLIDQANRASVTIYALDARGVAYTGLTAADDIGNRSPGQVDKELTARRQKLIDTQFGLRYLAKATGGFAVVNQNDLDRGFERILDDQSYYLVGFVPDEETFDPHEPRFNKIEIKSKVPGVQLRYRSGFFGVPGNKTDPAQPGKENKLFNALMSPLAVDQITVRLNALFNSSTESGPFLQSFLHVSADELSFQDQPDGSKKLVFDVLAVVLGDNGAVADQIYKTYSVAVKKEGFENFVREGFVYNFVFPMKKPGVYQLRVALRDQNSQKVGSANQFVEIPDLKKDRLAISGVTLENNPLSDPKRAINEPENSQRPDPLTDTAVRRFKSGTLLNYEFSIFNSRSASKTNASLKTQIKLYRDGKLVFDGQPQTVPAASIGASTTSLSGTLVLGSEMQPGDYVLQLSAIGNQGNKGSTASQFVDFEIVR